MKRPQLRKIPLADVLPLGTSPGVMATMSTGQWDSLLEALYREGVVLLELNRREVPVAAYQREGAEIPAARGN